MIKIPLSIITFSLLFWVFNRKKYNPSSKFVTGIQYAFMDEHIIKTSSISNRPNSKNTNNNPIIAHLAEIKETSFEKYYFSNYFSYLFPIFLSTIISIIISLPFGKLGLNEIINPFTYIGFFSFFIFLYLGSYISFNSNKNRKFALYFSIFNSFIFYFFLSNFNLGSFDIRIILNSFLNLPKYLINIIISIFLGIFSFSLSFSILKNLHSYTTMNTPNLEINKWKLCYDNLKKIQGFPKKILSLIYTFNPTSSILFFILIYFYPKFEFIFEILFIIYHFLISIIKIYYLKSEMQLLINESLRPFNKFFISKQYDDGKIALNTFFKTEKLLMIYATSLLINPLIVLLMIMIYISSFIMNDIFNIINRIFPLFILFCSDIIFGFIKIIPLSFEY